MQAIKLVQFKVFDEEEKDKSSIQNITAKSSSRHFPCHSLLENWTNTNVKNLNDVQSTFQVRMISMFLKETPNTAKTVIL